MTTGILITARLGSTRLKRKHLKEVMGIPLLGYLLDRIGREFQKEISEGQVQVVIATSDEPENRDFESLLPAGAAIFYGSLSNIPLRHLQAAQALGLERIVSVDGDDMLCSVSGMRQVYSALAQGSPYAKTAGLPFGMNSFGYSTGFLEEALGGHQKETLETGWGRIFKDSAVKEIAMVPLSDNPRLRFTLDYQDDFDFFDALIRALGDSVCRADDQMIVDTVNSAGLYNINAAIAEEYWRNFNKIVEKEVCVHEP